MRTQWIRTGRAAAAWSVAILPDALGIGALLAYVRFLQRADELMQRIQLEGLALGFGVGVVFATGYQLLALWRYR